jgi:hypothetical protein
MKKKGELEIYDNARDIFSSCLMYRRQNSCQKKKKKGEEDKIEETRSNFFDLLFSPVFDKFNGAFNLEIAIIIIIIFFF